MFETIEKLRAKPEGAKKRFAFFVAFIFCGVIFSVWLTVIYPNITKKNAVVVQNKDTSPSASFGSVLSTGFGTIKKQISEVKKSVESLSSKGVYYSATSSVENYPEDNTANVIDSSQNW